MYKPIEKMINIATVDSFTNIPYAGNPAGVVIFKPEETMSEKNMLLVAREMNLSETAFAFQHNGIPHQFHLRWFTPQVEVPLCGHATLATAHIIFEKYSSLLSGSDVIDFTTNVSGILKVKKSSDGGYQMDFPLGNPVHVKPDPSVLDEIAKLMNFDVKRVVDVWACSKTRKLLIEVDGIDVLPSLKPDFTNLCRIKFGLEAEIKGVMITTKGDEKFDFYTRYFAPWVGIPEDPVTGSAHTVLAAFWGKKLGLSKMKGFQASERGGSMKCHIMEHGRVILEGDAVTVMDGKLALPK
jgi:PhzF family phenazine biosynthesis protein